MTATGQPTTMPPLNLWRFLGACLRGDRARRRWIAEWLGLPAPRYRVAVTRRIAVPMPDGATLLADHYAPTTLGTYPTVLIRSPFGRAWEKLPFSFVYMFAAQRFAEQGYHVIVQSVRDKAEGDIFPGNESEDGLATAEWIAEQPWFNGSLGLWGQSYLGFTQWAIAQHHPPYLKALLPGLTSANMRSLYYDDDRVFTPEISLTVLSWIAQAKIPLWRRLRPQPDPLPAAYLRLPLSEADLVATGAPNKTYRAALANPEADDPFWRAVDLRAAVPAITTPTHLISGWFDIFLDDLLVDYAALQSSGRAPYFTVGPWGHFDPLAAVAMFREGLAWYDAQMRGAPLPREAPVRVFVLGVNTWRDLASWPPPSSPGVWLLRGHGQLVPATVGDRSVVADGADAPSEDDAPDSYRYDPMQPTPAVGGARLHSSAGQQDCRELAARPDVLSFRAEPLTTGLTIMGAPEVTLFVTSSATHTDFVARLCVVEADGRMLNITDNIRRLGPDDGEWLPDGSRRITIRLWPTAFHFAPGQRVCLLVMSGAHPRWSRNPGDGAPQGAATTLHVVEQTVYHDAMRPAHLTLPIVGE